MIGLRGRFSFRRQLPQRCGQRGVVGNGRHSVKKLLANCLTVTCVCGILYGSHLRNLDQTVVPQLTLPVAPQHASLASRSTTLFPLALSSSARYLAADVPVMPLPTMTISASAGSSSVVRCPIKNSLGSLCQKELLDAGVGSVERSCFMLRCRR